MLAEMMTPKQECCNHKVDVPIGVNSVSIGDKMCVKMIECH